MRIVERLISKRIRVCPFSHLTLVLCLSIGFSISACQPNLTNSNTFIEVDSFIPQNPVDFITTVNNLHLRSLPNLEAFIVDTLSKNIPVTGFRIYPTQYPKNYKIEKYQNRSTLIFTPTTKINGKIDVAFEPLYSEKGKPVEISNFLKQLRAKNVQKSGLLSFSTTIQDLESSSANRIQIVPPPH